MAAREGFNGQPSFSNIGELPDGDGELPKFLPLVHELPNVDGPLPVAAILTESLNPFEQGVISRHRGLGVFDRVCRLPEVPTDVTIIRGVLDPIRAGGMGAAMIVGGGRLQQPATTGSTRLHLER